MVVCLESDRVLVYGGLFGTGQYWCMMACLESGRAFGCMVACLESD